MAEGDRVVSMAFQHGVSTSGPHEEHHRINLPSVSDPNANYNVLMQVVFHSIVVVQPFNAS